MGARKVSLKKGMKVFGKKGISEPRLWSELAQKKRQAKLSGLEIMDIETKNYIDSLSRTKHILEALKKDMKGKKVKDKKAGMAKLVKGLSRKELGHVLVKLMVFERDLNNVRLVQSKKRIKDAVVEAKQEGLLKLLEGKDSELLKEVLIKERAKKKTK